MSSHKPVLSIDRVGHLPTMPEKYFNLVTDILKSGIPIKIKAYGNSMKPFIHSGDTAVIYPAVNRNFRLGDVVICAHPVSKRPLLHRIIRVEPHQLLIKGDANFSPDGFIHPKDVLGHVTCIERNGREFKIGIGIEKQIIAFLSRKGLLRFVTALIYKRNHLFFESTLL